jgi:hypothetical protein
MNIKYLISKNELISFQTEFVNRATNPLDLNYLSQSKVRGFLVRGELVGGYVLNSKGPFRYFNWVPKNVNNINKISHFFVDAVEITCIWINHEKISKFNRNIIYLMAIIDGLLSKKRYIIGGSINAKVASIQKEVLKQTIYKGEVELPGQPTGEIYASNWLQALYWVSVIFISESVKDIFKLTTRTLKPKKVSGGFTGVTRD